MKRYLHGVGGRFAFKRKKSDSAPEKRSAVKKRLRKRNETEALTKALCLLVWCWLPQGGNNARNNIQGDRKRNDLYTEAQQFNRELSDKKDGALAAACVQSGYWFIVALCVAVSLPATLSSEHSESENNFYYFCDRQCPGRKGLRFASSRRHWDE